MSIGIRRLTWHCVKWTRIIPPRLIEGRERPQALLHKGTKPNAKVGGEILNPNYYNNNNSNNNNSNNGNNSNDNNRNIRKKKI